MRPKKYQKSRQLTITIDDKDISYLDDHRGKVTRGDYLIESMYALKTENSERFKEMTASVKQLSQENHELKKQVMFMESKYRTSKTLEEPNLSEDIELIKWYEDKNIAEQISKMGRSINWENLFDKNMINLIKVKDAKTLEKICLEMYRNVAAEPGSEV